MSKVVFVLFLSLAGIGFSTAQVSLIKDIDPGLGGGTEQFAPAGVILGSSLIFPATTLQNGNELWISDGSEEGTMLIKDIRPGAGSSMPQSFFRAFNRVYFTAETPEEGRELWVTDGTPDGTQMVMDIEPGAESSDPLFGAIFKGSLFFAATSAGDREIWWLDSLTGPSLFMNLNANAQSRPRFFTVLGDKMYFAANEHAVDFTNNDEDEPYVSDGTPAGTIKLINVTFDNRGAGVREFTGVGSDVYFGASFEGGAAPNDHEIYKTDGTPANTALVQEDLYGCQWLTAYNNALYFFNDSKFYRMLPNGTFSIIAPIHNNPAYHLTRQITPFNDAMILPAAAGDGSTGVELYISKGTSATTSLLMDINPGPEPSNPSDFLDIGDKMLFAASSSVFDRELYITDGTTEGTSRVIDLVPGTGGSDVSRLVLGDGIVFFYAFTDEVGFELFKYEIEPSKTREIELSEFEGLVYPQPASAQDITVEWPIGHKWSSAALTNADGVHLRNYPSIIENKLVISAASLTPGVYYLNLKHDNRKAVTPVIVQ